MHEPEANSAQDWAQELGQNWLILSSLNSKKICRSKLFANICSSISNALKCEKYPEKPFHLQCWLLVITAEQEKLSLRTAAMPPRSKFLNNTHFFQRRGGFALRLSSRCPLTVKLISYQPKSSHHTAANKKIFQRVLLLICYGPWSSASCWIFSRWLEPYTFHAEHILPQNQYISWHAMLIMKYNFGLEQRPCHHYSTLLALWD